MSSAESTADALLERYLDLVAVRRRDLPAVERESNSMVVARNYEQARRVRDFVMIGSVRGSV